MSFIEDAFRAYIQYSPFSRYPVEVCLVCLILFYVIQYFVGRDLSQQVATQLAAPLVKEIRDMGFKQNPAFNTLTLDTATLKLPTIGNDYAAQPSDSDSDYDNDNDNNHDNHELNTQHQNDSDNENDIDTRMLSTGIDSCIDGDIEVTNVYDEDYTSIKDQLVIEANPKTAQKPATMGVIEQHQRYPSQKELFKRYLWQESLSTFHLAATEHPTLLGVHCSVNTIHRHDIVLQFLSFFNITPNFDSFTVQFAFHHLAPFFYHIYKDENETKKMQQNNEKGKIVDIFGIPLSSTVYKQTSEYIILTDTIEFVDMKHNNQNSPNFEREKSKYTASLPNTPFSPSILEFITTLNTATNGAFDLVSLCASDNNDENYVTISYNTLHQTLAKYKKDNGKPHATFYDLSEEQLGKVEQVNLLTATFKYNFMKVPPPSGGLGKTDPNNQEFINHWMKQIMVHLYLIAELLLKLELPSHIIERNLEMRTHANDQLDFVAGANKEKEKVMDDVDSVDLPKLKKMEKKKKRD